LALHEAGSLARSTNESIDNEARALDRRG